MGSDTKNILCVGGSADQRRRLSDQLKTCGYALAAADCAPEAMERAQDCHAVLLFSETGDVSPHKGALPLLNEWQRLPEAPPVIALSACASVQEAVQAMQQGATDYLAWPVSGARLAAALEFGMTATAAAFAETPPSDPQIQQPRIITQNAAMQTLLETVRRVADSGATILITGESGTGKELLAAYVHAHSGRVERPFVAMNCAALPDHLAESELFGHEKGAFTGALGRKLGRFELADGGTLLLDEIGELPLNLQAKLLRVLQEQVVDRLGGQAPIAVDTRVVATTNRNLRKMVADGEFREDLYFRLKVLPFQLPALRERREDIALLATSFVESFSDRHNRPVSGISTAALARLESYPWPGNIRELENALERAVLICREAEIQPQDLLLEHDEDPSQTELPPGTTVKEMERRLILSTLGQVNANRTRAAEMLGISIRTLRNKLNEYRADSPELFEGTG